jgi:hypothetical protein
VMWAFFTPTGFENFLQRLTVLTTLNVSNPRSGDTPR